MRENCARVPQLTSLSCFFPAHNEEGNVARSLDEVVTTIPQFATTWEAVIIDDGSTDRTAAIVREYAGRHSEIRVVQHERNLGYGRAPDGSLRMHGRGRVLRRRRSPVPPRRHRPRTARV